MGELYYVSISIDAMTQENAQALFDYAKELNGGNIQGLSIHYSEAIV